MTKITKLFLLFILILSSCCKKERANTQSTSEWWSNLKTYVKTEDCKKREYIMVHSDSIRRVMHNCRYPIHKKAKQ